MHTFSRIDVKVASKMLQNTSPLIVDIRDLDSYNSNHISGAIHISKEDMKKFICNTDKNISIIVYCYHGNGSQQFAQFLVQQGFLHVYSVDGGYEEWKNRRV